VIRPIQQNGGPMGRRLVPVLAAIGCLLLPGSAPAARRPPKAPAIPAATVKITHIGHLHGGKARIYSTVPVIGTVDPFVAGQRVQVSFYVNGKQVERHTVRLSKGKRGRGTFRARIRIESAGNYAVSAKHVATAALGGDSTVRKSWRVSFPALHRGQCGVLAYRKVNGMARSERAGAGLVRRVFAGRGGYRVRHPSAGEHVEVPLSKQVLAFAKGDRPFAIYPVSSGKSSTPTVTGHFTFIRREPGYNSHGMYYSFYFYGGYAVHGYESVPDYPASHGCIRTFIADQPEIYDRIRYGESIFIF
jgi:hypothetical protein